MRTLTQLFKTDKSANLTVHYRVKVGEKNTRCVTCVLQDTGTATSTCKQSSISILHLSNLGQGTG